MSPRVRNAVLKAEGINPPGTNAQTSFRQSDRPYVPGLVTAFGVLGVNRWAYAWTKSYITAARLIVPDNNGPSGTVADNFAINTFEACNTGSGVEGNSVNIDGADYPAGFELQPVGGRQSFDPEEPGYLLIGKIIPVRIWFDFLEDGTVQPTFDYPNADDGTCEAP